MKKIKESDIEKYLVEQVKLAGGEVRKVQWIGRRGAPDRFLMFPHCESFWVELKAPGVKAEDYQLREHKRMETFGCTVYVVDSFEKVDVLMPYYYA